MDRSLRLQTPSLPNEWVRIRKSILKLVVMKISSISLPSRASQEWYRSPRVQSRALSFLAKKKSQRIRLLRVVGREDCQIAIRIKDKCSGASKGPKRSMVIKAGSICELKHLLEMPECFGWTLILRNASWNSTLSPPQPLHSYQEVYKRLPPLVSNESATKSVSPLLILSIFTCIPMLHIHMNLHSLTKLS